MGEAGVTRALEVIYKELDTSMGLCGRRDVQDLDRDVLMVPKGSPTIGSSAPGHAVGFGVFAGRNRKA